VVVLFVTAGAIASLTLIVNVLVSLRLAAERLSVGSNTSARIAVVAAEGVPVKVYTPDPALTNPEAVSDAVVNTPLAASSTVTETDKVVPASTSPSVTSANGERVALSLTVCPAAAPPTVGASFTLVVTTVVALSVVAATSPSLALIANVVVSVAAGASRLAVGTNSKARIAVVAAAAVPVKVYTPPPEFVNPELVSDAELNAPFADALNVTVTVRL